MNDRHFIDATSAWLYSLSRILQCGSNYSPRGQQTREILNANFSLDMKHPVLHIPSRKLSYKFMAAEALWMLNGDNTVDGIAPYNPNISAFSDDGSIFFGAYGPRIMDQMDYIIKSLIHDPDSRQAVLTIWRENPAPSKDIPCTISMTFHIRDGLLHSHTFMRSSDIWLGLPYDIFNFSMVAFYVMLKHNECIIPSAEIDLGKLYLTLASSHLYYRNFNDATQCMIDGYTDIKPGIPKGKEIPTDFIRTTNQLKLELDLSRDNLPSENWDIRK